jgi:hypothetical protein
VPEGPNQTPLDERLSGELLDHCAGRGRACLTSIHRRDGGTGARALCGVWPWGVLPSVTHQTTAGTVLTSLQCPGSGNQAAEGGELTMSHTARRRCPGCGRALGTVVGPTLALEDVPVLVTPHGVVVTCPDCRSERTWTLKRSAESEVTRRR